MAEVIWLPEAIAALDEVRAYIRQFNPDAAERLVSRLIDAGNSLVDFPNRGRPSAHGRRELVTVSPYILRYVVQDGTVYVITVRHSARQPD